MGRVTGLLGPNGAGKSSTLRILLGMDRPDAGTALIHGSTYRSLPVPLKIVGSLLEGAGAHPSRTGRNHLRWVAASNGIQSARIDEVLDEVGLSEAARRRVGTYSLGMRQRLGLATAMLGSPQVLVLDEPVNGLDPDGIRWIRRLLRRFADAGGTVLLSSHMLAEVAEVADDLVIMSSGQVAATGPLSAFGSEGRSLEASYFSLTG